MSLTSIVEQMLGQAKELDAYLTANSISTPSTDNDTLAQLPANLQDTRVALADAAEDFKKLIRGPVVNTMDTILAVSDRRSSYRWNAAKTKSAIHSLDAVKDLDSLDVAGAKG